MDFTGRPMRGFVTVGPQGLKGASLRRWVSLALTQAESRPPTRAKPADGPALCEVLTDPDLD
jgi:hypothetical protein